MQVEVMVAAAAGLAGGEGQGGGWFGQVPHRLPHCTQGPTHAPSRPSTAVPGKMTRPAATSSIGSATQKGDSAYGLQAAADAIQGVQCKAFHTAS